MDTDDALQKIFGRLSGGRLEDVADKLIALFRAPEWWEAEFDAQCVAGGSIGALPDAVQQVAIKAYIRTLLTRAQHEERQKLLRDIERISEAFFAGGGSPDEQASARQLSTFLLHALRQQDAPG
jgi:hypothetical protein